MEWLETVEWAGGGLAAGWRWAGGGLAVGWSWVGRGLAVGQRTGQCLTAAAVDHLHLFYHRALATLARPEQQQLQLVPGRLARLLELGINPLRNTSHLYGPPPKPIPPQKNLV